MISDPEGVAAGDVTELAEAKPKAKARKKKATEVVEASESVAAVEAAPEVKAKPAKKAAVKKAKPSESVEEVAEAAVPEEPVVKPVEKKTAKKAAAKKRASEEPVADQPIEAPAAQAGADWEEPETPALKGPEPKLERLQKILAKAGISSRRKAEELIVGGRVQINGKVVMELGTKADPARDHVRVDGKLLQGPERIRYFVLNKPKGFVTTVSDPEGRPTVMQFFAGEHERLYPVGRLDYLSEGLLLVTNDGELANKLTKAASGVEKTYLVKVAGQPTEDMLDVLRGGVVIERGRPGENTGRVRTAPAKIRQVRQGDNPWYEVIIIEGRNRELRKMFEEIGHHVEKIRRVGYGPLVLDLEPGKLRELEAEEVHLLHMAAAGKLKKKSGKSLAAGQLPTVAGKTVRYKKADGKPGYEPRPRTPRPEFQTESKAEYKPAIRAVPKAAFKPTGKPEFKTEFKPGFKKEFKPAGKPGERPALRSESKPEFRPGSGFKPGFKSAGRPAFGSKPGGKPRRPEPPATDYVLPPRKSGPIEPESESAFNPDYKPGFRTGSGAKPAFRSESPGGKPAFRQDGPPKRFGREDTRKPFKPAAPRTGGTPPLGRYNAADDDFVPKKTPGFRVEPVEDKPRGERPARTGGFDRAGGGKPFRPAAGRPAGGDRPFRPRADAPSGEAKPFRPRPAGASSGRPAAGRPAFGRSAGAPPAGRPFRSSSRPESGSERPARFTPRTDDTRSREPRPRPGSPISDRPRTDRPAGGPPKKFSNSSSSAKPFRPAAGAKGKPGPDGEPRKKERWRNSFTGKNKGRPKPKKAE
jgi:23S rRNA pseudouridine2605 synthase